MTKSREEGHRKAAVLAIVCAALGVASASVHAQEFSVIAGALKSSSNNTYSWEGTYREGLGRYAAWSFSWLNEGHIPDHHRDGQAVQFWGRLPLWNNRLELSAGAGPYRWFDTKQAQLGGDYSNTHGWGGLFSLRAAYYFDNRWLAEVKLNRVQAYGGPDTTALLFGIGYQLDAPEGPGPRARPPSRTTDVTSNEVTVMLGTTILNSPDSESNLAESIEYRRGLWHYVDFTASYLHEGGHVQSRRDGVAAQLWATRAFFDDRLTLGVGIGPYLSITQNDELPQNRTGDGRFSGLVSVSASYRFTDRWLARVTWNRMVTRYDRDADIIEAGVGVRF
ncbi:hypothetical protein ACW9YV_08000 [Paraburkholderia strydomiana]